jgi:hypothetical protein
METRRGLIVGPTSVLKYEPPTHLVFLACNRAFLVLLALLALGLHVPLLLGPPLVFELLLGLPLAGL